MASRQHIAKVKMKIVNSSNGIAVKCTDMHCYGKRSCSPAFEQISDIRALKLGGLPTTICRDRMTSYVNKVEAIELFSRKTHL